MVQTFLIDQLVVRLAKVYLDSNEVNLARL